MWRRANHAPPPHCYAHHTVPSCRPPPALVMVQPPLPLPSYGAGFVQPPPYLLPPLPAPTPVWWDHYPGPSYQNEFPMLSSPEAELNGYQSSPFRKRKWPGNNARRGFPEHQGLSNSDGWPWRCLNSSHPCLGIEHGGAEHFIIYFADGRLQVSILIRYLIIMCHTCNVICFVAGAN